MFSDKSASVSVNLDPLMTRAKSTLDYHNFNNNIDRYCYHNSLPDLIFGVSVHYIRNWYNTI